MVQSQFALTWGSYKTNICSGFSSFQQNGELVDMTLAADGHLVKVHQVLVALSSPYLKQLIVSVPSQHPVIFLNNVSHATLSLILEYIYTGEVRVPAEHLPNFMEAAKALHIRGLETIVDTGNTKTEVKTDENTAHNTKSIRKKSNPSEQIILPPSAKKILVNVKDVDSTAMIAVQKPSLGSNTDDEMQYSDRMDDTGNDYDDDDNSQDRLQVTSKNEHTNQKSSKTSTINDKFGSNLQFTVSIRGALQVILNRYIYNLHSTQSSGMRRWRCIDYRNKKCSAFVVTKNNIVMNRANPHNHSFHDKKILDKIEKNAVYSALDDVQDLATKEKERNSPERSEFVSI